VAQCGNFVTHCGGMVPQLGDVHCLKTAVSTFDTSHAALNYPLCGGCYNNCVIFGVFFTHYLCLHPGIRYI
jgi:hypothetical protein